MFCLGCPVMLISYPPFLKASIEICIKKNCVLVFFCVLVITLPLQAGHTCVWGREKGLFGPAAPSLFKPILFVLKSAPDRRHFCGPNGWCEGGKKFQIILEKVSDNVGILTP